MLSLYIKYRESIIIQTEQGDVEVTVLHRSNNEYQNGAVRLSISAPKSIKIYRSELLKGK